MSDNPIHQDLPATRKDVYELQKRNRNVDTKVAQTMHEIIRNYNSLEQEAYTLLDRRNLNHLTIHDGAREADLWEVAQELIRMRSGAQDHHLFDQPNVEYSLVTPTRAFRTPLNTELYSSNDIENDEVVDVTPTRSFGLKRTNADTHTGPQPKRTRVPQTRVTDATATASKMTHDPFHVDSDDEDKDKVSLFAVRKKYDFEAKKVLDRLTEAGDPWIDLQMEPESHAYYVKGPKVEYTDTPDSKNRYQLSKFPSYNYVYKGIQAQLDALDDIAKQSAPIFAQATLAYLDRLSMHIHNNEEEKDAGLTIKQLQQKYLRALSKGFGKNYQSRLRAPDFIPESIMAQDEEKKIANWVPRNLRLNNNNNKSKTPGKQHRTTKYQVPDDCPPPSTTHKPVVDRFPIPNMDKTRPDTASVVEGFNAKEETAPIPGSFSRSIRSIVEDPPRKSSPLSSMVKDATLRSAEPVVVQKPYPIDELIKSMDSFRKSLAQVYEMAESSLKKMEAFEAAQDALAKEVNRQSEVLNALSKDFHAQTKGVNTNDTVVAELVEKVNAQSLRFGDLKADYNTSQVTMGQDIGGVKAQMTRLSEDMSELRKNP